MLQWRKWMLGIIIIRGAQYVKGDILIEVVIECTCLDITGMVEENQLYPQKGRRQIWIKVLYQYETIRIITVARAEEHIQAREIITIISKGYTLKSYKKQFNYQHQHHRSHAIQACQAIIYTITFT